MSRSKAKAQTGTVETWSVSEVDKKGKKKKGTLGIGNGAMFFASDQDKVGSLSLHRLPSQAFQRMVSCERDLDLRGVRQVEKRLVPGNRAADNPRIGGQTSGEPA